jgi:hypothetical protein
MPIRCRSFVSTTRGTIVPERPGFRSYGSNVARRPVNWGAGVPGRFGQEVKLRLDHPFGVRDVPPVRTQADPIRLSGPGPGGGIGSPSTRRPIKRSIPQDPVQRRDAPPAMGCRMWTVTPAGTTLRGGDPNPKDYTRLSKSMLAVSRSPQAVPTPFRWR